MTSRAGRRVPWAPLLAGTFASGGLSAVATGLAFRWLRAAWQTDFAIPFRGPEAPLEPIPLGMVLVASAAPALLASGMLALLGFFLRDPLPLFSLTALLVLLFTLAAPFALAGHHRRHAPRPLSAPRRGGNHSHSSSRSHLEAPERHRPVIVGRGLPRAGAANMGRGRGLGAASQWERRRVAPRMRLRHHESRHTRHAPRRLPSRLRLAWLPGRRVVGCATLAPAEQARAGDGLLAEAGHDGIPSSVRG